MNDDEEWPYLSPGFIRRLNETVPERCAEPTETLAQIHHYAGKRALVNLLIRISEEQHNKGN